MHLQIQILSCFFYSFPVLTEKKKQLSNHEKQQQLFSLACLRVAFGLSMGSPGNGFGPASGLLSYTSGLQCKYKINKKKSILSISALMWISKDIFS